VVVLGVVAASVVLGEVAVLIARRFPFIRTPEG